MGGEGEIEGVGVGQRCLKSWACSGRAWGTWWDQGLWRPHHSRAGGGMSPIRKEMAWREAGTHGWYGESDGFPVKRHGCYPCCQQKAHAEEEVLCYSCMQAASWPCHSYILQLALNRVYQVFFWRVSEVFQPCFALAARNVVHVVLTRSIRARRHNACVAALGALDQTWEVQGDVDDHRMAYRGL